MVVGCPPSVAWPELMRTQHRSLGIRWRPKRSVHSLRRLSKQHKLSHHASVLDRRKHLSVVHLQPRVAPPLQNTLSHPWLGFLILCVGISHQLEVHSNTTGSCESACRKASSNPAAVGAIAEARPHFFGSRAIPSFQAGTKWLKHVLRRLSCSACNRRRMETLIILFKL